MQCKLHRRMGSFVWGHGPCVLVPSTYLSRFYCSYSPINNSKPTQISQRRYHQISLCPLPRSEGGLFHHVSTLSSGLPTKFTKNDFGFVSTLRPPGPLLQSENFLHMVWISPNVSSSRSLSFQLSVGLHCKDLGLDLNIPLLLIGWRERYQRIIERDSNEAKVGLHPKDTRSL